MTEQINVEQGILRAFEIRRHICTFLNDALPQLPGTNWWDSRVIRDLEYDKPKMNDWSKLDILGLLRIFRRNLPDICKKFGKKFTEYNPLVWEMIHIRHVDEGHRAEAPPPQDVYRYIDTLERFANFIGNEELLKELQTTKKSVLKDIWTESGAKDPLTDTTVTALVDEATIELIGFLGTVLAKFSSDWWDKQVLNELSPKERKAIRDKGINTLDRLSSEMLFRVLAANWDHICKRLKWRKNDNYYLILAVLSILGSKTQNTEDIYRNLDTLGRFVSIISSNEDLINKIQSAKESLLKEMQNASGFQQTIESNEEGGDQRATAKTESNEEAYRQKITTARPGCIVILADQSESMDERLGKKIKADIVAEAVNAVIAQLITVCTRGEEIKDRCHICVIGYGEEVRYIVNDMVSKLYKRPEAGKRVPTWLTTKASNTTPMAEAFELAYQVVQKSCSEHTKSFPPVVINITDGVPNDYPSTKDAAKKIMELQTTDGNALVFNVHIADSGKEISLPNSTAQFEKETYAEYADFLFQISSVLPEPLFQRAESHGFSPLPGSRCLGYNADVALMIRLLQFGSQPTRKGRREPRPIPRPKA